jgi:hypothetical protein
LNDTVISSDQMALIIWATKNNWLEMLLEESSGGLIWGANVALSYMKAAWIPVDSNRAMRNTIHEHYSWNSLTAYEILLVPVLISGGGICFTLDVTAVGIIITRLSGLLS